MNLSGDIDIRLLYIQVFTQGKYIRKIKFLTVIITYWNVDSTFWVFLGQLFFFFFLRLRFGQKTGTGLSSLSWKILVDIWNAPSFCQGMGDVQIYRHQQYREYICAGYTRHQRSIYSEDTCEKRQTVISLNWYRCKLGTRIRPAFYSTRSSTGSDQSAKKKSMKWNLVFINLVFVVFHLLLQVFAQFGKLLSFLTAQHTQWVNSHNPDPASCLVSLSFDSPCLSTKLFQDS